MEKLIAHCNTHYSNDSEHNKLVFINQIIYRISQLNDDKQKRVSIINTTLQLFHKKNVIQDFLMYNKFANKKIRKKVILYDRLIIQRKNYNW